MDQTPNTQPLNAIIVVPTCEPEAIFKFLDAWRDEFEGHRIIVTEDADAKRIDFTRYGNVESYSATEWRAEWGEDAWILPRGNAGHRAFGFWKAWQYSLKENCDIVVTLDDDCFPDQPNFLRKHYSTLQQSFPLEWTSSVPDDHSVLTRGYPYGVRAGRPVYVNHGLWSNVPDLDAPTQLTNPSIRFGIVDRQSKLIPRGTYFPFSGMNVAWRPPATPLLYFMLMGSGWPFDRFDDIWAGVLMKKAADHLRWAVTSGLPSVHHSRLSNVFQNLVKEARGIQENENFWQFVDDIPLQGDQPVQLYRQLGERMSLHATEYFQDLGKAMIIWANKFGSTSIGE